MFLTNPLSVLIASVIWSQLKADFYLFTEKTWKQCLQLFYTLPTPELRAIKARDLVHPSGKIEAAETILGDAYPGIEVYLLASNFCNLLRFEIRTHDGLGNDSKAVHKG